MPLSSCSDNADENSDDSCGQRPYTPLSAEEAHAPTAVQAKENGRQPRAERSLPEPPASAVCIKGAIRVAHGMSLCE